MQPIHITAVIVLVGYSAAIDINNTAPSEINPQYLIDVGVKTNDAKLEAIGLAMKNLHQTKCNGWSTWSKCTSRLGYFGTKRRFRKCLNETEIKLNLCIGRCPSDYDVTPNGYCLKMHFSRKLPDEAENQCVLEGGYLVRVNSQAKYDDIKKLKLPSNFASFFHIGGRRKHPKSPVITFQDGTRMTFFKWAKSEPDNETCMYLQTIPRVMHDAPCPQKFPYLCEVPV